MEQQCLCLFVSQREEKEETRNLWKCKTIYAVVTILFYIISKDPFKLGLGLYCVMNNFFLLYVKKENKEKKVPSGIFA